MTNIYARVMALGAVCGLRSMLGPALVAQKASPKIRGLFRVLLVGELVADKLPTTPSRLLPGPLIGRMVSGGAVGYVLCRRSHGSPWAGVLLGAVAAVAGAYGGGYARRALGARLRVPDPAVALLEDALAFGVGRRFVQ